MSLVSYGYGNAYGNVTAEAKELHRQYLQFCNGCTRASCSGADAETCKARKKEILNAMLDISDTRVFCVVTSKCGSSPLVRHILMVKGQTKEQAAARLDELKKEYYEVYARLPDDTFYLFKGLHRAQAFAEAFTNE